MDRLPRASRHDELDEALTSHDMAIIRRSRALLAASVSLHELLG